MFGKLLAVILFILILTFVFRQMIGIEEGFRGDPEWSFSDSGVFNREETRDCQCEGAACTGYYCGWNNSVSRDDRYNFAPESLKGKERVFKYPHYYGYGTGSGFHYGEPYYRRTVEY